MTEQQHPIVPPPDKIHNWLQLEKIDYNLEQIITLAVQWGADQELKACCKWVGQWRCLVGGNRPENELRAARRPKPPSLKEEATAAIVRLSKKYPGYEGADIETIRRAIEALPND